MSGNNRRHYDVAVVGAGIVGLAHAAAAVKRGLSVVVLDRAAGILGASIRNFGHICLTGQDGRAREYGEESRERWLSLAAEAGFWLSETGTVVVAQAPDESAVLDEFRDLRGADDIVLLGADQVRDRVPVAPGRIRSGAWLPRDLQVDPREAVGAIARWLRDGGVDFHFTTAVLGVEPGRVHTARGPFIADTVIVAVNADVDQLFPVLAETHRVQRCGLDMLLVDAELDGPLTSPLFTGWSLIRYAGFARTASAAALRARLVVEHPDLAALDLNQMYTQRPDGGLIVGDTHYRGDGIEPFQGEPAFDALLALARDLFGVRDVRVRERWQGVYASAPEDFLVASPLPDVRVVSVTTGIGMTTGLGLAERVIDDLFASTRSEDLSEPTTSLFAR
jgi:FAD dependent oxidoreductase TIGR03364